MAEPESTAQILGKITDWIDEQNSSALANCFEDLEVDDKTLIASRLDSDHQVRLLELLPPGMSADIIHALPFESATDIVDDMSPEALAEVFAELTTSEQADFVSEMDDDHAEAILAALKADDAARVKNLVGYNDDVAGGLMDNEFVALDRTTTVSQAIEHLRSNARELRDFEVQYVYVVNQSGKLTGVLRLRDLLLADGKTTVESIMIQSPVSVNDQMPLDELREFFVDNHFLGVPVVNEQGILCGVVNRTAVEMALGERAADDYLKTQGVIREELRTMPLMLRSRRRLMWLSANIVLNLIAASVIAVYEDTLRQVIALAIFLPIISDMSGCSGNQAVAVSMRELSLGLVEPREVLRVWLKEISVGVINGFMLGLLLAILAGLWQSSPWLGVVVGLSLMVNTVVAVSLGGTLPLIMKLMRLDPALASGPILTTVTDLCGFFLVLGLASQMLHLLVPA